MRKLLIFFKLGLLDTLSDRGPVIIWMMRSVISFFRTLAIWLAAEVTDKDIGGYTREELITYYLLVFFLEQVIEWGVYYTVNEEILEGRINFYLVKPLSYLKTTFARELGFKAVSLFFQIIPCIVLCFILRESITFGSVSANFPFTLPYLLIGMLIVFLMQMCIGVIGLFTVESKRLMYFYYFFFAFFSGTWLPLSFFPSLFHKVMNFLPFRYTFSLPLEILMGKLSMSEIMYGYLVGIIWLILLVFIYEILWKKGLRAYTAYGG